MFYSFFANLNKEKPQNYEELNGKSSFNDYNEPTNIEKEDDEDNNEHINQANALADKVYFGNIQYLRSHLSFDHLAE